MKYVARFFLSHSKDVVTFLVTDLRASGVPDKEVLKEAHIVIAFPFPRELQVFKDGGGLFKQYSKEVSEKDLVEWIKWGYSLDKFPAYRPVI